MSLTSAVLTVPRCHNMQELPAGLDARVHLQDMLTKGALEAELQTSPLYKHLLHGLAYTTGSALGFDPPPRSECLAAFAAPATSSGLTAGAKAWTKHAHRSCDGDRVGWWGEQPRGPVVSINERALALFDKVMDGASWRNLHWLPHEVLAYEVRVLEGYGMRWSRDGLWTFRGFLEPMMEDGHEVGWRH